jgi:hypothetical protein
MAKLEIIGKKFGRLTVLKYLSKGEGYECECECGNKTKARSWALKTGRHSSCGCLQKELLVARFSKPNFEALKNEIFKNYLKSAEKRKYIFNLNKEFFFKLIESNCYYCGSEPNMVWKGTKRTVINTENFKYNGVDRKDNTIGYTEENCVACCKICNNSKSTMTEKEWFTWIKKIHEYQNL